MSDKDTKLKLQLIEMGNGKVILSKLVNAVVGENLIPVDVTTFIHSAGHYVLILGNETIK